MNALPFLAVDPGTEYLVPQSYTRDLSPVERSDFAAGMIVQRRGAVSVRAILGPGGVSSHHNLNLVTLAEAAAPSARALNELPSVSSEASKALDNASHRLFDLKVATAEVAMHLEQDWRSGLFRQLDDLLDDENWDLGDLLPSPAAFRTFLRLVVSLGRPKRPSIGCADDGSIIASWRRGIDRLTIESRPNDWIRWVLVSGADDTFESGSGICKLQDLNSRLKSYRPEKWFYADDEHSRFRRDIAAREGEIAGERP